METANKNVKTMTVKRIILRIYVGYVKKVAAFVKIYMLVKKKKSNIRKKSVNLEGKSMYTKSDFFKNIFIHLYLRNLTERKFREYLLRKTMKKINVTNQP